MKKWFLATLVAAMASSSAMAAIRFVPLEEIAAEADTGVVGRVADVYTAWDSEHKMIWTHYVVDRVESVFGNEQDSRFEMLFAGGTVDGKTMIVTETPTLEIGVEYVFFAYDNAKKYSAPTVGHYQGLFKVVRDQNTGATQLVNGESRLMGGDEQGRIVAGPFVTVDAENRIELAPMSREEVGTPEGEPVIRDYRGHKVAAEAAVEAPEAPKPLAPIDLATFLSHMQDLRVRFRGEK